MKTTNLFVIVISGIFNLQDALIRKPCCTMLMLIKRCCLYCVKSPSVGLAVYFHSPSIADILFCYVSRLKLFSRIFGTYKLEQ